MRKNSDTEINKNRKTNSTEPNKNQKTNGTESNKNPKTNETEIKNSADMRGVPEDLDRILLSEAEIAQKVGEAAAWLDKRFCSATVPPLAISVLKGSVFFFCDVVRAMKTPVRLDFMKVSSYGDAAESSGIPRILMDLSEPVEGRDVILIEDIVDSGNTLVKMKELILGRGAKSFTVVTMLDKPARRQLPVKADYSCYEVGNEFIVGYGLDYANMYRDLPFIGVLKREVYEK